MPLEHVRVSVVIPASPQRLYDAWLDEAEHSAFTGAKATVVPRVGGKFSAHNGYIWGKTLELDKGKRIVQSWRTADFPEDAEDSQLEIKFKPTASGTRMIFVHRAIPENQGLRYHHGWQQHYFKPMLDYFERYPDAAPSKRATRSDGATTGAKQAAAPQKSSSKASAKKKVVAKKQAAKKQGSGKKAASKKTAAKKPAGKKPAAKKPAAEKPAAEKPAAKKKAAKKKAAKRAAGGRKRR